MRQRCVNGWRCCRVSGLVWDAAPGTKQPVSARHARVRCVVIEPRLSPGTDAVDGVGAAEDQMIARDGGRGPE